ncbi:ABC transporter permease [Phytoactinopolyspora halophila]|uniref:ABC transporter permease n=1 Tax=Phytoactinopolyspora halophila TaxID=1981511 RepID=UPI0014793D0E|nr:ABC transporter permease [Phytoactinopolyspora halophila]
MSALVRDQETPDQTGRKPSWRAVLDRFGSSGPLLGLLLLVAILSVLSPAFLTVNNFVNVFQQISVLAILALGMTAVIITAGIDLSVGSVLALAGVTAGWTFAEAGMPMPFAFLAGLGIGALAGLANGLMITLGKLPPFIATLAMLSMARGLALVISDGRPISGYPDWFRAITRFQLFGVVPLSVLLVVILFLLGAAYLRYRPSGRALYAIGGNEEVARLSGLNVRREKIKVYTVAGALAGLGGLILMARLNSAQPTAGTGMELDVIAAVVIGGASLAGGRGSVSGTLVGALIIGVLRNGLNLLDVSSFWQQVVIGAVIAIAVMTDTLRRRSKH